MLVLGVESSCDETSVAIYDGNKMLSNVVLSQIDIHKEFGGVVPEVASRHHVRNVSIVFKEALELANVEPKDISLVAVTEGPGLIGSLLVGITAAKTFAMMYDIPIIGVIEPGARAALGVTQSKKIGVIGTEATIRSQMYDKIIQGFDTQATVIGKACPLFVPWVREIKCTPKSWSSPILQARRCARLRA